MIKAWIINLKNAQQRKQKMQEKISSLNVDIDFDFFEAISPYDERFLLYQKHWNWDWLSKIYRGKPLSLGEKACFASHYALWEKCVQTKEPMLVLEDDIGFEENFVEKVHFLLSSHYSFVRLTPTFQKPYILLDSYVAESSLGVCGTLGYYLTPISAQKFLKYSQRWICPVDNFIDKFYIHHVRNLYLQPPAIFEESGESCIGGEGRNQKPNPVFIITREISASVEFIWRKIYEYIH